MFRYEQERDSAKKQYKQEAIEYILSFNYGETVMHEELSKILHYNINDEKEYKKYKLMMQVIKNYLIEKGYILKSISGLGYYILKPSQVSKHCYRTYILKAGRTFDKSEFVLDHVDKTELNDIRLEEINNIMELNKQLIDNTWKSIQESTYYSRKDAYDNSED